MSAAREYQWRPGEQAVISRTVVVTIGRVTPAGFAVVADPHKGMRTFGRDGRERTSAADYYKRAWLEPLTPEIQAEMTLAARAAQARRDAFRAVDAAERWLRDHLPDYAGARMPIEAEVAKAERIAAAITAAMEDPPGS